MPSKNATNCCSVSWFVILITCSVISLTLVYINSSVFNVNSSITTAPVKSEQISVPSNVTVTQFAENSDDNLYVEKSYVEISENEPAVEESDNQPAEASNGCEGKYIYVLDLPSMFNSDIVQNCSGLSPWPEMCTLMNNSGMGPQIYDSGEGVFTGSCWYATDQFSLEVLFRNRMKQYRCLTDDYAKASAVYVHYYPGLDVARYLWHTPAEVRDAISLKFIDYIKQRPEWNKMGGRDHFLVVGRTTYDFRRASVNYSENAMDGSDWGSRLFLFPEVQNMTRLVIEAHPSSKSEIGIPYPTSFHPSSDEQVHSWQEKMTQKKRPYLFSFAGAARPSMQGSLRNLIIEKCQAAEHCKFLDCNLGVTYCNIPQTTARLFQNSDFCLQPPGDSYTRKSVFDTMLAGCIPVLFHPASTYVQYLWHLPKNYTKYSVFIPMDDVKNGIVSIEKRLLEIPKEQIKAMREEVIRLIPRIAYANPNTKLDGLEDAFDVAVKGVLERINKIKMDMEGGKKSTFESVADEFAWKYNFFGNLKNNEWDKYFGDNFFHM